MSAPLTFGELAIGEEFIAFPRDGDDSGHGGYRAGSYLFYKMTDRYDDAPNARRYSDDTTSRMPTGMLVLKVIS